MGSIMTDSTMVAKEQEWFTCDLSREELKGFMQRDNLHGALHVGLWFFLLGVTGFLAYWTMKTFGAGWSVPVFLFYGVIYCACDARWHECSHGTVFRTPWLNEAVHFIATAMQQRDIVTTRWSHARHHSYTIINGIDPEITLTRPPNLLKALINYFNIEQGISYFRNTVIQSFGIPSKLAKEVVPKEDYPKVFFWSRMTLSLYILVASWAVASQSWLPLLFFGLPRFYGGVLQWMFVVAQHGGLADDVWDHRKNSRTILVNPFLGFLYMNMQYHIEHHMYPLAPFHALPKLHERVRDQMPAPYKGLWAVYKEMVPVLFKQLKHPEVFIDRPVPESRSASAPTTAEAILSEADGWIKACAAEVLAENDVLGVERNRKSYAIYRIKDKGFFATDGLCTHEQARLADGLVCDCTIACPKHNARFNICTGEALSRPAKEPLKTYPVKQQNGDLFICTTESANQPVN
jgi:MocE subfamily Rieske [2Fe-2S] domain protein